MIYLNRLMPLEGGLYQWAKQGFGEMAGFLTAWNLWVYAIVSTGSIVFVIPTDISYMFGPSAAWLPASKLATLALTGVGDGGHRPGGHSRTRYRQVAAQHRQHTHPAGLRDPAGAAALGAMEWTNPSYTPVPWQMPKLDWFGVAIFGQITVGGLSGFEYVAILAGECRSASRTIGQSVVISAPIIALMFILGTSSVLTFVGTSTHQRHRAHPADPARGHGKFGRRRIGRTVRHRAADCPRHCRRQPAAHWPDTTAHDRRMGSSGAGAGSRGSIRDGARP